MTTEEEIEREKLLDKCRHEISMIGNFIDLISVFLGTNMLMISRNETKYFLNEIIGCIESKRGHLFEADLGFDKNDNLSMIPNRNKFLNDIMRSITHIVEQIIEHGLKDRINISLFELIQYMKYKLNKKELRLCLKVCRTNCVSSSTSGGLRNHRQKGAKMKKKYNTVKRKLGKKKTMKKKNSKK